MILTGSKDRFLVPVILLGTKDIPGCKTGSIGGYQPEGKTLSPPVPVVLPFNQHYDSILSNADCIVS